LVKELQCFNSAWNVGDIINNMVVVVVVVVVVVAAAALQYMK
jgi:hypothetical protein